MFLVPGDDVHVTSEQFKAVLIPCCAAIGCSEVAHNSGGWVVASQSVIVDDGFKIDFLWYLALTIHIDRLEPKYHDSIIDSIHATLIVLQLEHS